MADATFDWRGDRAKDAVRRGARAAVQRTADAILAASLQVVPRRTSALAEAAGTSMADYLPVGTVYYDDARDVKTIKQHEDLTYYHPPGESAKFLERPARAAAASFRGSVSNEVGRELR